MVNSVVFWTLSSCCCSTIGIELYSQQVIGSSFSLLTFATFLFMSAVCLVEHPHLLTRRRIPFRVYLIFFFLVNVANNRVLSYKLSFPLIIVFRSGTLVANVLLTWLLQNRTYSAGRICSVLLVTFGIALFTLASHRKADTLAEIDGLKDGTAEAGTSSSFVFGIFVLIFTLFASAYMGIVQEEVFLRYGKHPEEMMFYVHFLSLPFFLLVASEIKSDLVKLADERFTLPSLFAILVLQLLCIRSVYRLAADTSSLQVTMTLTLRKFLNIFFSVIIFKNTFGFWQLIASAFVLLGSFTFYDGLTRSWHQILKFGWSKDHKTKLKMS